MPNVHLTEPMHNYVQGQIQSGAYANLSEVARAGIRLLERFPPKLHRGISWSHEIVRAFFGSEFLQYGAAVLPKIVRISTRPLS